MLVYTLLGLALALPSLAWLPDEPSRPPLLANDGTSLFFRNYRPGAPLTNPKPIRGVNLGSLFVAEPWMMWDSWNRMGCPADTSEFDCVSAKVQAQADQKFQEHWSNFIPESDFSKMTKEYGLNTIRIPIGYWMMESLVFQDSERFPRGGFDALKRVCGWAADRGMYIILDLHGAPGAQQVREASTGQKAPTPGFYVDWQYKRAIDFAVWIREQINKYREFRTVGMYEVVNEPLRQWQPDGANEKANDMRRNYYPKAYKAIRDKEAQLGISRENYIHIQFQNKLWGSGDPQEFLTDNYFAAYDDHRYLKYALPNVEDKNTYLRTSCQDNRSGDSNVGWDWPVMVGEWSLSAPFFDNGRDSYAEEWSNAWRPNGNENFYRDWFEAQVQAYEKHTIGWTFWSWHSEVKKDGVIDYRWGYKEAVDAGVIPRDLDSVADSQVCARFYSQCF